MDSAGTIIAVVAVGVAMMVGGIAQAEWKHKSLIYGMIGLGAFVILIGIAFPWLGNWAPRFGRFLTYIDTNLATWFATLVFLLSAAVLRWRRDPQRMDDLVKTVINIH